MKYTLFAGTFLVAPLLHALEQVSSLTQLNTKINQHTAVVVKVYRDNCPPCRQLAPIMTKFATSHANYTFYEVNSGQARDIVAHYTINKVPTILYFYNGKLVGRDTGSQSYTALEKRTQELFK